MRALPLLLLLLGCDRHDSSLYRIDCETVDCPTANVEYVIDNNVYRCWWACLDERQLNYYFELRGGCWHWDRAEESHCDDDPPCTWECLYERLCQHVPVCPE